MGPRAKCKGQLLSRQKQPVTFGDFRRKSHRFLYRQMARLSTCWIAMTLLPAAYAATMTMCWYTTDGCKGSPSNVMAYSSISPGSCYQYITLGGDPLGTNGKYFYVETFLQDNHGNAASYFGFDWNCGSLLGTCGLCQVDYSKSVTFNAVQPWYSCSGSTCNGGNNNCACSGFLGNCTNSPLTTFSQAMPKLIVVNGGASMCPGNSGGSKQNPSLGWAALPVLLLVASLRL